MLKRKFKIKRHEPAKLITEMDSDELHLFVRKAFEMSNAAGYADDASRQNMWEGFRGEAESRLKTLEASNA